MEGVEQGQRQRQIGRQAVLELNQSDIVDEIGGPGFLEEQLGARREEMAVHQRPSVVGVAGVQAGDETAEADLRQDQNQQRPGLETKAAGVRAERVAVIGREADRGPDRGGESQRGEQKLERQGPLRRFDARESGGRGDPPAGEALQEDQRQNDGEPRAQGADDLAPRREPRQGQGEKRAGDRRPFGDGGFRFGEPRRAAADESGEQAGCRQPQPQPSARKGSAGAGLALTCRRFAISARRPGAGKTKAAAGAAAAKGRSGRAYSGEPPPMWP